uniref:CENP-V/GFA domain-containing protein n=1 Tax=Catharus ustulatus TaxID=91951 RepID=A0A8C3US69_CATUS
MRRGTRRGWSVSREGNRAGEGAGAAGGAEGAGKGAQPGARGAQGGPSPLYSSLTGGCAVPIPREQGRMRGHGLKLCQGSFRRRMGRGAAGGTRRSRRGSAAAGGTRRARGRNAGGTPDGAKAEPPGPGTIDLGAQSGRWAAFQERHRLSLTGPGGLVKHTGGCHCGAVRFEVWASADLHVFNCNCSICTKKQNRHFIVPASRFKLLKGADNLTTYTFNTHRAQHTFCKTCGVQSFYTPRSNPDGYGIAPHCLDDGTVQTIITEDINGKEWEKAMKEHKTIRDITPSC